MILLKQSDVYSAILLSGHSQYSQISGFHFFNVSWCVGQPAVRRGKRMTCTSSFKWLLTGLFTSQRNFWTWYTGKSESTGFVLQRTRMMVSPSLKKKKNKKNLLEQEQCDSLFICLVFFHLHLPIELGYPSFVISRQP